MSKRYSESSVPSSEAAIVTAGGMTELELVLPEVADPGDLPEAARFLIACAMRYHDDPGFVERQLTWLAQHLAPPGNQT
jgi:hypothetical protein